MSLLRKFFLTDETDPTKTAAVAQNVDRDTNLDGFFGVLSNAMMFGRVSDTIVKNSRLDASTEALMTVSYAHHEVHSGSHYFHRMHHSIAKNGTFDHLIITPNTTKWSHMIIGVEGLSSSIEVTLYEDATVSANGTGVTAVNRNRNSANTAGTLIYTSPTVTGVGTAIADAIFGAGKNSAGGGSRDHEEIILKQNTIYLLRATEQNIQATDVNYDFSWYEHTDRN